MSNNFQEIVAKLIQDVKLPNLLFHQQEASRIRRKYDPRNVFNTWRDSDEGKAWKLEEYKRINGVCPRCQNSLPNIQYFEIDHIKPISTYPELAIDVKNLRLLFSPCNKIKGKTD